MADKSNEVLFSVLTMQVSSSGAVSFIIALAVSAVLLAFAWRLVRR